MSDEDLIVWCLSKLEDSNILEFPEYFLGEITEEQAKGLIRRFGDQAFFKLNQKEIDFFNWLKIEDSDVWNDLWDNETEEVPYVVSLAFLPIIIEGSRGYPICDLNSNENFYFTLEHLLTSESQDFLESVRNRFLNKEKLTIEQLLILEISLNPIDIWHFAYKYKININKAKEAARNLNEDKILVHLKEATQLAAFVNI